MAWALSEGRPAPRAREDPERGPAEVGVVPAERGPPGYIPSYNKVINDLEEGTAPDFVDAAC